MKALVAGPCFKGIGDSSTGPAVLGKMQDALRIGLAKSRGRVELESECIIGGMARSPDHACLPNQLSEAQV
jgi:hypothetical protein